MAITGELDHFEGEDCIITFEKEFITGNSTDRTAAVYNVEGTVMNWNISGGNQPTEDVRLVVRISNTAVSRTAVPGGDIITGDGTPEAVLRIGNISPAFTAGEQAFNARTIAANFILCLIDGTGFFMDNEFAMLAQPLTLLCFFIHRHQVFSTG